MLNHSISNKMISLNSLNQFSGENAIPDVSRRRRTPSKYAQSIKQLTRITSKNSRKDKYSESNQDQTPQISSQKTDRGNKLQCFLPSKNKKLRLSIIIKKIPKTKLKKSPSQPPQSQFHAQLTVSPIGQTQPQKNISLLDTLLQVVEQFKVDEQKQNKKQEMLFQNKMNQVASAEVEAIRKQTKNRKQREEEEKYLRFYEKYRGLCEKFQGVEGELVLI